MDTKVMIRVSGFFFFFWRVSASQYLFGIVFELCQPFPWFWVDPFNRLATPTSSSDLKEAFGLWLHFKVPFWYIYLSHSHLF